MKIIIRTCLRDDYLAKVCLESFKLQKIEAEYSFLAETGNYTYIPQTQTNIIYRPKCDNYGGQFGVRGLLRSLKNYSFLDDETIILSDSDIIVFDNFITHIDDSDHLGVGGIDPNNGLFHISGQMQIFKGKILNKLVELTDNQVDEVVHEMVRKNISVADDTFNSYMTDKWNCKKSLIPLHKWLHFKAYGFEKINTQQIINHFKEKMKDLI